MDAKVAIVLHAGTENDEGLARAFLSLVYAKDLKEHGADVRLIFDGAATQWPVQFHHPHTENEERLASLWSDLSGQGVACEICDY